MSIGNTSSYGAVRPVLAGVVRNETIWTTVPLQPGRAVVHAGLPESAARPPTSYGRYLVRAWDGAMRRNGYGPTQPGAGRIPLETTRKIDPHVLCLVSEARNRLATCGDRREAQNVLAQLEKSLSAVKVRPNSDTSRFIDSVRRSAKAAVDWEVQPRYPLQSNASGGRDVQDGTRQHPVVATGATLNR